MVKKCPKSGKRYFRSRRAAKKATKRVHNKFRIYRCPFCRSLHVTGETRSESAR